jgi:hypothetical protein
MGRPQKAFFRSLSFLCGKGLSFAWLDLFQLPQIVDEISVIIVLRHKLSALQSFKSLSPSVDELNRKAKSQMIQMAGKWISFHRHSD